MTNVRETQVDNAGTRPQLACHFVDEIDRFTRDALKDPKRGRELADYVRAQLKSGVSIADFALGLGLATDHDARFINNMPQEIQEAIRSVILESLDREPPIPVFFKFEEAAYFEVSVSMREPQNKVLVTLRGVHD